MANQENTIQPFKWVLITAGGFIIFLGLAIVFSIYSDKLNIISTSTYFFLLVAIALIAAGFLFGALRSHAKYSGKAYNGTLELSGPVVVLTLIIFLGYKFRPTENSFSSTVNLFSSDSLHAAINDGKLTVYYGTAHLSKKITEGQVVINEMPKAFRGKEVTLIPSVEGYSSKAQKMTMPVNENVLNLYLEKIPDSVMISGIILTKAGKVVNNAEVVFADGLIKTRSDRLGNFRINLPFKDGTETNVRIYQNDILKYNNLVRLSNKSALTLQMN